MVPKIIALYLPQYHPIKENDEWYGKGYTEWTNVAKAKPLFKGHYQPHIPADLGFYDLRLPEVREAQSKLAEEAGVTAFCYYHYWFGNGKLVLEKPLEEVIQSKKPDFPFCICWANHAWYKKEWNPDTNVLDNTLLLKPEYSEEDFIEHFNYLLPAFKDKRYLKIDEKLLFVIFQIWELPDFDVFKKTWNSLAKENGLPEFYFLSFANSKEQLSEIESYNTEGKVLSLLHQIEPLPPQNKLQTLKNIIKYTWLSLIKRPRLIFEYKDAMEKFLDPVCEREDIIPVIIPNWDTTPRRKMIATIFNHCTPELFKEHVRRSFRMISNKPDEKQILFLKSWNEWGEGNYMEPDLKYGKGYIKALREVVEEFKNM